MDWEPLKYQCGYKAEVPAGGDPTSSSEEMRVRAHFSKGGDGGPRSPEMEAI